MFAFRKQSQNANKAKMQCVHYPDNKSGIDVIIPLAYRLALTICYKSLGQPHPPKVTKEFHQYANDEGCFLQDLYKLQNVIYYLIKFLNSLGLIAINILFHYANNRSWPTGNNIHHFTVRM
jgi:hypothetical protein